MKIGIVGHFGDGYNLLNGQTIKTRNLYYGLSKYTDHSLAKVDTRGWSKHPVKLLIELRKAFKECNVVIILTAQNGIKVFPKLFKVFKANYHVKIYYDVVGGWLPDLLNANKKLLSILKCFDGIWVETRTMKQALEKLGLVNVTVVPNFKELRPLKESEIEYPPDIPFRLCTFSRVMKEKGIDTIVEAVNEVNKALGYTVFSLDVYGQIQSGQEGWFEELKRNFPTYIQYKGCVDSEKSIETLKNYFALVFPTHYEGEGFAGTLIDAFAAGVPVIASDWKYNKEIVHNNVGIVYNTFDIKELENILVDLYKNPCKAFSMKKDCLKEVNNYKADYVIGKIDKLLSL